VILLRILAVMLLIPSSLALYRFAQDARAEAILGQVKLASKDFDLDLAYALVQQSLALEPRNAGAWLEKATLERNFWQSRNRAEYKPRAIASLERAAALNTASTKPLVELALLHSYGEDYITASNTMNRALKLSSSDANLWAQKGRFQELAGNKAAAIGSYQKSYQIYPTDSILAQLKDLGATP
jgi:tetratricopeptide (TPR) repeat protein